MSKVHTPVLFVLAAFSILLCQVELDKFHIALLWKLASFPGLPHFYLPLAFTIIHGSKRPAKKWGRPGSIHHVRRCEVDVGGEGPIYLLNLKASFLPVKMSSFHHAKVWIVNANGRSKRGRPGTEAMWKHWQLHHGDSVSQLGCCTALQCWLCIAPGAYEQSVLIATTTVMTLRTFVVDRWYSLALHVLGLYMAICSVVLFWVGVKYSLV